MSKDQPNRLPDCIRCWRRTGAVALLVVAGLGAKPPWAAGRGEATPAQMPDQRPDQEVGRTVDELPKPHIPPGGIELPVSVRRGDVLTARVRAAPTAAVQARLIHPDGRVIAASVFGMPDADASERIALVGVPSTMGAGSYLFVAETRGPEGNVEVFTATVEVADRLFVTERIPLSTAMSALRQTEDPRRDRETRELIALLNHVDPAALYDPGPFYLPVGQVRQSSFFGDRRTFEYSDGGVATSIHYGIDYAVPTGTPIVSAAAGRVVMATDRLITGLSVVVEHLPGVYALYYHLDRIEVEEGQIIARGQRLGTVGATGLVTGPHLHWEIRVAGVAVDPESLLTRSLFDLGPRPTEATGAVDNATESVAR